MISAEAEQAVVVACCMDPGAVAFAGDLAPSSFAIPKWKAAWSVIVEMFGAGEAIDPIIVADRATANGSNIQPVELVDNSAQYTSLSVERYAKVVSDARISRELALACSQTLESIKSGADISTTLSEAYRLIHDVSEDVPDNTRSAGDVIRGRFKELHGVVTGEIKTDTIATGIESLDGRLGGLQRGVVTVAAGRPGMGKSAFAMSVVDGASREGVGCHVFSLEDTAQAYGDRLISRFSKVPVENLRNPLSLKRDHLVQIDFNTREIIKRSGWIIDDRSGITAEEIVQAVRRHRVKNNTGLVVVDYINLIKVQPFTKRHEAIDAVMNTFATAAKQDNMSYVVLAQLNRGCESRDNKRPMLSDLKESGGIEEKAKCVLFVYRPFVYGERDEAGLPIPEAVAEIIIRKNNQGATGIVGASFDPKTIRIS